jgi:hypothetical protein
MTTEPITNQRAKDGDMSEVEFTIQKSLRETLSLDFDIRNWDCAYPNGFPVLSEGLEIAKIRTFVTIGSMPFLEGKEFWLGSEPHSGSVIETKETCNRLGIPGLLRKYMHGTDSDQWRTQKFFSGGGGV